MKKLNCDILIIGAGLAGMVTAAKLIQQGKKVLLIDPQDQIGGKFSSSLQFFPEIPGSAEALQSLENILNLKIAAESADQTLHCFEDHEWKAHMGFGENTPKFYEIFQNNLSPQQHILNLQSEEWLPRFAEIIGDRFLPRTQATQIVVENGTIKNIVANAAIEIHAQKFIFCAPLHVLTALLPNELWPKNLRTQWGKAQAISALFLNIAHTLPLNDTPEGILILNNNAEEIVFGKVAADKLSSQWMIHITKDEVEDSEIAGNKLKAMKKMIKKALPQAFEDHKERVNLVEDFDALNFKPAKDIHFHELTNFWLATAAIGPRPRWIAAIDAAQMVVAEVAVGISPGAAPEIGL